MTDQHKLLLKVAGVLWVIWGLVHAFAGVMTIAQDAPNAVAAIADAVNPALVAGPYHEAANALLNQHGFNLLWVGIATTIGGVLVWQANMTWIWVTAMLGGLFDVGYFVYMDLGGYTNFFPGTVMTVISAAAVLLSGFVFMKNRQTAT
ncbi:MAG: hypothetical protein AAFO73_01855 [Pseudomonadota bacterium]